MIFSSGIFLFAFLPLFLAGYFLVPRAARNHVLVFASLFFYAWTEPTFVFWALGSTLADYVLGGWIHRTRGAQESTAKYLVGLGILLNIALLAWFKYTNFAIETLSNTFGLHFEGWHKVALPVAVSFIVFEKITYLVDIYRGNGRPADGLLSYLLYVFFFPKLLAGPIIRYCDIETQIRTRTVSFADVIQGASRFIIGLAKKVLLADHLGAFADKVFAAAPNSLSSGLTWLGVACFTFQIFFDFSGYSDMAIGLGRVMGFRLLENFTGPYLATSITEFWRRWHISLSTWIREYLYIPLGGNRKGPARTYFNLVFCFFLCGLWHGAAWPFILWGVYQGALLLAEKAFLLRLKELLPPFANWILTVLLFVFGWVVFRSQDTSQIIDLSSRMLGIREATQDSVLWFSPDLVAALVASVLVCLSPWLLAPQRLGALLRFEHIGPLRFIGLLVLLLGSIARISTDTFHAFLYFRF